MNVTGIEWTATVLPDGTTEPGLTSNPVKYRDTGTNKVVWACVKHSPGCAHCYAETLALRYGRGGPFTKAAMDKVEPFVCDKELKALLTSKKLTGRKVFVGDMTDVFGEWVTDGMLDRLFAAFACRRDVTFQVLTKRADRLREYMASRSKSAQHWKDAARTFGYALEFDGYSLIPFPLPNVWLGVSVEDQKRADERIPLLLQTPAAVRFLSCEPLLSGLDLARYLSPVIDDALDCPAGPEREFFKGRWPGIDWLIVGGESGAGSRTCHLDWIRAVIRQCREAGVPAFVKQLGAAACDERNGVAGRSLNVPAEAAPLVSLRLKNPKGGDMDEWPESVRVRQFPAALQGAR